MDKNLPWDSCRYFWGCAVTFTPPARADSDSPRRRLSSARWIAVNDEEQAVSTVMLGPRRSRVCETRLATAACIAVGATPSASVSSW
ncbi:hypothetical protein GCM10027444_33870 [Actinopolyspora lacussalsi]